MKAMLFFIVALVPLNLVGQETIEKIDERLEELKTIWYQEQAIINGYTKNRTVPVKEGSREYYACLEASKRIQQAEKEAAELKIKKSLIASGKSPSTGESQTEKQMKEIIAKYQAGEIDPSVADAQLRQLAERRAHRHALGLPDESSVEKSEIKALEVPEKSVEEPAVSKTRLGVNHTKLIGFWRSVKKSDLDGEYIYQAFSESEEWHILDWEPYKVVREEENRLIYSSIQDTGTLGKFEHTIRVDFIEGGKIKILADKISPGVIYERISEDQWTNEQEDLDEESLQKLRGKLQGLIKQIEHQ